MPAEANGDPECVETKSEPVPVDEKGDTVETNGEREPEPVCTGISKGEDELGASI